ncbi:phage tail protein [Pokkaliibacter sp. CJK22405]|uniref:phage tail protein n=1 Tax=Pokkaliibacter sp. CJK22405 TaxID=3384615 RepID=UPI0039855C43
MTAASFCPKGTYETKGQLLAISSNTALFSLLGCTYGGNCQTTFALPNLSGRFVMGEGAGTSLSVRTQGMVFGAETVTALQSNLPVHNHSISFAPGQVVFSAVTDSSQSSSPANGYALGTVVGPTSTSSAKLYASSAGANTVTMGAMPASQAGVSLSVAGQNMPMSKIPPTTVVRYCIANQGIYPSRN